MRSSLWMVLLAVTGCCGGGESPNGPPEAGQVGTSTDGASFVEWGQSYLWGCYEAHVGVNLAYILVSASGEQRSIDRAPPLLAADCSDQPVELGTCVSATMTAPHVSTFSYLLEGNDQVVAAAGSVSRITPNGTTLWSVAGCHAGEAIRGTTLVLSCGRSAEMIDVDTGLAIWTVQAPDRL